MRSRDDEVVQLGEGNERLIISAAGPNLSVNSRGVRYFRWSELDGS